MNGNTTFHYRNSSLLSVVAVEAPVTVTSDDMDELLAPARKRMRLPKGTLQRVAGVFERRQWQNDEGWLQGVISAGERAIARSGVSRDKIGLIINTSVTRKHLEPSIAVAVHSGLGLPTSAMDFDITNACLGFVNGLMLASTMIDGGHIEYALIVGGEDTAEMHRRTIERLNSKDATRDDFQMQFASLTLGSGAAAAVVGPADKHPEGHLIKGGIARAGTEHNQLCVGSMGDMRTDTKGLLEHGLELVVDAWRDAHEEGFDFRSADTFVTHQISNVYTRAFSNAVGVEIDKIPVTFPDWGNVGPSSLPMTLAKVQDTFTKGDKIVLLGVGSGINTAMLELEW
ncbi:3-oxoacyl-ACP synthase III [Dermabacteraceae bacterium P13115]|nr:3-oxoacyl-ACP synthase III [Dermabacteraceae bacterium TAE3-ERU5]